MFSDGFLQIPSDFLDGLGNNYLVSWIALSWWCRSFS